jgi:hypothetical protein
MINAYLVGVLDITKSPPIVSRVEIMSTNAEFIAQNLKKEFLFDITFNDGVSFEDAEDNVMHLVQTASALSWVRPFFVK